MSALPSTRGQCLDMPRPCPHAGCRHSLLVEIGRRGRTSTETCALDVADEGEHTLIEVGEVFGLTRERIRQIETKALKKLAKAAKLRRFDLAR